MKQLCTLDHFTQRTDAPGFLIIRDTGNRSYKDVSEMIASLLEGVGVRNEPAQERRKRKLVREWTLADLLPLIEGDALKAAAPARGQTIFREAQCHRCHRVGAAGGVLGPNLTGVSARFKPRDILEAIVEPDKVIADQFRTTIFRKTDGTQVTGQIVNLSQGAIHIRLDPSRPFPRVRIVENEIEEMQLSKTSLMPKGLLNTWTRDDIRDLLAYLLEAPNNR